MNKIYDRNSKRILLNKEIAWYVMKELIPEYKNSSKEEILRCIEDGDINKKYIEGINTEDINDDNTKIVYDVLFTAKLPNSSSKIGLYINFEAQNSLYAGYPILKRAIYYASRLLTHQESKNGHINRYNLLKKVYFIWICMDPPKYKENSINYYSIYEHNIAGAFKDENNNYDLINVVIIHLSKSNKLNNANLLNLLNLLFLNDKISSEHLSKILRKDYNVNVKDKEVLRMWDMSSGVERIFRREGIKEGRAKGKLDMAKDTISYLISNNNMTFEEASKFIGLKKDIKNKISKYFN